MKTELRDALAQLSQTAAPHLGAREAVRLEALLLTALAELDEAEADVAHLKFSLATEERTFEEIMNAIGEMLGFDPKWRDKGRMNCLGEAEKVKQELVKLRQDSFDKGKYS